MSDTLGRCDFKQYEHCGPHERIPEIGQRLPPFACRNWRPEPNTGSASGLSENVRAHSSASLLESASESVSSDTPASPVGDEGLWVHNVTIRDLRAARAALALLNGEVK